MNVDFHVIVASYVFVASTTSVVVMLLILVYDAMMKKAEQFVRKHIHSWKIVDVDVSLYVIRECDCGERHRAYYADIEHEKIPKTTWAYADVSWFNAPKHSKYTDQW